MTRTLTAVAICVAIVGCGSKKQDPQAAVKSFLAAYTAKDYATACQYVAPDGNGVLNERMLQANTSDFLSGKAKIPDNPSCAFNLKSYATSTNTSGASLVSNLGYERTVTNTQQGTSTVKTTNGDWKLEQIQGRWKLDSFEPLFNAR